MFNDIININEYISEKSLRVPSGRVVLGSSGVRPLGVPGQGRPGVPQPLLRFPPRQDLQMNPPRPPHASWESQIGPCSALLDTLSPSGLSCGIVLEVMT